MKEYLLKLISPEDITLSTKKLSLPYGQNLKGLVSSYCAATLQKLPSGEYNLIANSPASIEIFCFVITKDTSKITVQEAYSMEKQRLDMLCQL